MEGKKRGVDGNRTPVARVRGQTVTTSPPFAEHISYTILITLFVDGENSLVFAISMQSYGPCILI